MEKEKLFGILLKVCFVVVILQSFYLQILRFRTYSGLSKKQSIRTIEIGVPRGRILDRNGRVLAQDTPCFNLVFIPYDLKHPDRAAEIVAERLKIDRQEIRKAFDRKYLNPFDRIVLAKNISREDVSFIEEHAYELPGVFVQAGIDRYYPLKEIACHVLGYVGEVSQVQLDLLKEKGIKAGYVIGQSGLEKYYDDYIRGISGGILVEVDALGHHRRVLGEKEMKPGDDLVLTIDQTFQEAAAEALGEQHGCVVAMDPRTGQILALVSKPGFDSDNLVRSLNSSGNPFLNRAVQGQYPPGSVFKIVTEIAGLDSGAIEVHDRIECPNPAVLTVGDVDFHCWKDDGHGWMDVNMALPFSCDIYFGTVGMKMGVEKILDYARMFRLGQPTGIDLPGEKSGSLPGRGDTSGPLNVSIGQGAVLTTPMQLCSLIAAVANGGNIWQPYLVKKIVSPEGKTVKEFQPSLNGTIYISPETLDILKKGLKNVVAMGTGGGARVQGLEVAGKTGTSQRASSELGLSTHGLFVCYAPADDPTVAMAVFIDSGVSGQAAQITSRILQKVMFPPEDKTGVDTTIDGPSGGTDET